MAVTSFVSVSETKSAFASNNTLYIADNKNNILLKKPYTAKTVKGSTPFCAQLSKDGSMLAFHINPGEIQLLNTKNGELIKTINADFNFVGDMEFADAENLLIVREEYGGWSMRYFDISSGNEVKIKTLELPSYSKEVSSFCLNADQSKLVLVHRGANAYIYDFPAKKLLHEFKISHTVKTVKTKFIGDKLGIRTDYGCFSLYNV